MKFIDLSHTINNDIPVFPGDHPVELQKNKEIGKDGYNNYQLCCGMHIGTHIDGPMHLTDDSKFISELTADRFAGEGVIFDVRNIDEISVNDIDSARIESGKIILFHSGKDKIFGSEDYFNHHPILTEDLVNFLADKKVKMIGIDWPSPDLEPYPMHKKLLGNDILILENLKNLDQLLNESHITIFAFPLKITADSSMVRAVAWIRESAASLKI